MRTLSFLASVFALALVTSACTVEQEQPTTSGGKQPKKGTTTHPGAENQNGEHGSNAPADETTNAEPPAPGATISSETWETGKQIAANGTIAAGATVTISPGAIVTMAKDTTITVKGTLKVAAGASHAKMTGTGWGGIIIAQGGTLEADGLEIIGAADALWTQPGNAGASFKNGVIDAATPFKMEAGSKLTIDHSSVKASAGSAIAGTFVATFMNYDKTTAGGLTLNDPAGSMSITDSKLTGAGGGDYVISSAGKSLTLAYTTVGGSHCGLHFSGIDQFSLDHVSVENNSYGAMLYGSTENGKNTITSSNFRANSTVDIDLSGVNGAIAIDKSFLIAPTKLAPTNKAATAIPDAQPRAQ